MSKRIIGSVMLAVFLLSMAASFVLADPPGCKRRRKEGCPAGRCYVDCGGGCFFDGHTLVCLR